MPAKLTTKEAARAVGISQITLQRWLALRKVSKVPGLSIQQGRAVRLWRPADIIRLRRLKEQIYAQGRGRRTDLERKKKRA